MKKYFIFLAIVVVGCNANKPAPIIIRDTLWQVDSTNIIVSIHGTRMAFDLKHLLSLYIADTFVTIKGSPYPDSLINTYQVWPASSGAKIHIYNQDTGKGYIFRKYQDRLPKTR